MEELGFPITNLDMTRSRRHYNCYRAAYPSMYEQSNILKPELVMETYVALLPFPTTKRMVDNYVAAESNAELMKWIVDYAVRDMDVGQRFKLPKGG